MLKTFRATRLAELWARTARPGSTEAARPHPDPLDRLNAATAPLEMTSWHEFHALRGFKPARYTVHINGPWCITFEFANGHAYESISNSITNGDDMAFAAKRNANRCPTHPGALLREDIIPAVNRSVREVAGLLGISRQHLHAIMAEKKPSRRRLPCGLADCLATIRGFG